VANHLSASHPTPRAAINAALDTFALVLREWHPGVVALPLRDAGADGAALAPGAGQVIRPFAVPEHPRPALNWNASVTALDYRRASRAGEDTRAVPDS
jgi:hypothetical protein